MTPVFKKEGRNLVNYKHLSVLTVISKIFERKLHKQIVSYIDKYLSPYLCAVYGYSKGYYIQQVLNSIIESWRIMIDKKGYTGAVLKDISKAFNIINHELLIAKQRAYSV